MIHYDMLAFLVSVQVRELSHEHFIFPYFEILSHLMDRVTAKGNLKTCHFIQSVKSELLPYRFNGDKSDNVVQVGI